MTRVAILQSNYIPWRGYFQLMDSVDIFVLYDVVQYTKNDWRNRNRILINGAPAWLTIPVRHKRLDQRICDTEVSDGRWTIKHWKTLRQAYGSYPAFMELESSLKDTFEECAEMKFLSEINLRFLQFVTNYFEITTKLVSAQNFDLPLDRVERLQTICQKLNATTYVSGPAAEEYLTQEMMSEVGTKIEWFQYGPFPKYMQKSEGYFENLSVLDAMLTAGRDSLNVD